jgi:hypothetical protein
MSTEFIRDGKMTFNSLILRFNKQKRISRPKSHQKEHVSNKKCRLKQSKLLGK